MLVGNLIASMRTEGVHNYFAFWFSENQTLLSLVKYFGKQCKIYSIRIVIIFFIIYEFGIMDV